ncbi:MAG TPA: hypothetical protein VMM54_07925 [Nitrospirota bacterium]|nr:hypothetical protein [Nitrospirota bacterium]
MKTFVVFTSLSLILLTSAVTANAGEARVIELIDGSIIRGEVLSLTGGVYTIKSDSLGMIKLEESKISVIRAKSAGHGANKDVVSQSSDEIRSLQEKMMSDKEIMSMIQSLQDDPEFQKLLENPEVMKAVNSGDVAALMSNAQFMKLLNNSTLRDIQSKVK